MTHRLVLLLTHEELACEFVLTITQCARTFTAHTRAVEIDLSAHKAGINAKRHAHVCIKIEALACAVVNHCRTGEACKAIHHKHIACSCLSTYTGSKRC